jgi:hypothetical protein
MLTVYFLIFLLIVMIIYLIVLTIQLYSQFSNKSYRLIIAGQYGLFLLLCSILIIRISNQEFNYLINDNHALSLLGKFGVISGLISIIFWLNAIEILEFSDLFLFSKHNIIKKLPYIIIGISIYSFSFFRT